MGANGSERGPWLVLDIGILLVLVWIVVSRKLSCVLMDAWLVIPLVQDLVC